MRKIVNAIKCKLGYHNLVILGTAPSLYTPNETVVAFNCNKCHRKCDDARLIPDDKLQEFLNLFN